MNIDSQWISAIAGSISALGITLIGWQIYLQNKQMENDHERSRRENAVKLIQNWTTRLDHRSTLARKLVEKFTEEQCRKLYAQEKFNISEDYKFLYLGCLDGVCIENDIEINKNNKEITVNEAQSAHLRWLIVSYINMLESVLIASRHGIATKKIIEEQFLYLISPEEGRYALSEFRTAAGGNKCYPAIEEFIEKLKKHYKLNPGHEKIA